MAYPGEILQAVSAQGGTISIKPYQQLVTNAPTTSNKAIGGSIVYTASGGVYMMTDPSSAQWTNLSGGSGVFTTLTVSGATTLNGTATLNDTTAINAGFTVASGTADISIGADATDHDIDIGSATGSSATVFQWGTGGAIFAGSATSTYQLGAADNTGDMSLGISTAGQDLYIASAINAGAQKVDIANGASAADNTVNILSGLATAGTQTLNLANGEYAKAVNIANGALGNTVLMGNGANSVAQTISIANGASAADSTVNILSGVGTAGAGTLTLANNTRVTTVDIGNIAPAASRTLTLGGGTVVAASVTDTINIGTGGSTTNADSIKNVNIGTGAVDIGSSTVAIGTSALTTSGAAVLNLGTGTAAAGTHTVNIGTGTGGGTKKVNVGNADGLTDIVMRSPIESSAGLSHTLNGSMGAVTCTGVTTGSGSDQTITITNSSVSATSGIIVGVGVVGAEDAQMAIQKVTPAAGSFTVLLHNYGAAALASNLIISFIVLS